MSKDKFVKYFLIGILLFQCLFLKAQTNLQFSQWGTGFAISSNGYIVTNYHVVYLTKKERVGELFRVYRIVNGEAVGYKAKIVETDYLNDLAILKIDDTSFQSLPKLPYKLVTTSADKGSAVFTLGFPRFDIQGLETKVSTGIIIAKSGFQGEVGHYSISAAIDHGSSGGPLFDSDGNVIGVTDSGLSTDDSKKISNTAISTSQFYAIKSSRILPMLDGLPIIKIPEQNNISTLSLSEKIKQLEPFVFLVATYQSDNLSTKQNKAQTEYPNAKYSIGQNVFFKDGRKERNGNILIIKKGFKGYYYVIEIIKDSGAKDIRTVFEKEIYIR